MDCDFTNFLCLFTQQRDHFAHHAHQINSHNPYYYQEYVQAAQGGGSRRDLPLPPHDNQATDHHSPTCSKPTRSWPAHSKPTHGKPTCSKPTRS
ncbi:hypothetical protein BC938DRAFT_474645 [Jimgerdemannia flammicorona]|uniref:Uncharacterized protein n=1 Tax=Jimgerdemannia flammicorona TaxID=994334 RepID=A0A433Q276_9FUNG|nr:hypothetical protein BC938DRAFT_474645 [Jimgerdemannia flammicorona]